MHDDTDDTDDTDTNPHSAEIAARFAALPPELLERIREMTTLLAEHATGPETTASYDAVINPDLARHGLAQMTIWTPGIGARTYVSTLEALERGS